MKTLPFYIVLFLFLGPLATAQQLDSLECLKHVELILKSEEAKEWQNAVVAVQVSKMTWLPKNAKNSFREIPLESYDYEWKTQRWREYQLKPKQGTSALIVAGRRITDSLETVLSFKSNNLRDRIALLGDITPCRSALSSKIFTPITDSIRIVMQQFRESRKGQLLQH